jgi:zinc/manganese transport system substrate-binding protein
MRDGLAMLVASAVILAAVPAAHAQERKDSNRLSIVASFSILRDLVANVGGNRVDVTALVGPGGDAHAYEPSPADVKTVGAAGLIVINGLGFEGWMERLAQASAATAPVVVASAGVVPRRAGNPGGAVQASGSDPHAWQSVHNAEIYVSNIRDGLIRADPPGRTIYEGHAAAYLAELDRLDADIRRVVAEIPAGRRKIITTHDAFGYFAAEYGFAFVAAQGVSSETDPSARDIARIIRTVREQQIPALFFEAAVDRRLVRRIAAETGARIGGTLYADTLSAPAGPAATYIDMMRHNIHEIVKEMK